MKRELYFDISSETSGGSLYRIKDEKENIWFIHQHSNYNDDTDEIKVFETTYTSFDEFWQMLTKDAEWFYQHPLYVHPEKRSFVKQQLQHVNWNLHPDKRWQESHQRQWKKVLESSSEYYRSG